MDVREEVVGDRIVRDEAASSRAECSPKTLSPFSRTGLKRCGFGGLGEGCEEAAAGGEATKGDEANRQRPKRRAVRIQCPLQKTFQLPRDLSYTHRVWQKFRYRLGSFPQPAARRDEARRAAEEERAWMSLLFSSSYMWGKNLPYKKVQLLLN